MKWVSRVYNWLNCIHAAAFPTICHLCGRESEADVPLCLGCLADLPTNEYGCRRCGIPLSVEKGVCGRCRQSLSPVEQSVIPMRYAPPLDFLLQQMKFHRRLELTALLAGFIAEEVARREGPLPQLLLPVPMHRRRLRQRGYNQAVELARHLSRQFGIPFERYGGRRVRHTVAQTALHGRERRRNLRGVFAVSGPLPRHVAIVDDVVTTGSTVQEYARTLHRAGAEVIEVWACARAGESRR